MPDHGASFSFYGTAAGGTAPTASASFDGDATADFLDIADTNFAWLFWAGKRTMDSDRWLGSVSKATQNHRLGLQFSNNTSAESAAIVFDDNASPVKAFIPRYNSTNRSASGIRDVVSYGGLQIGVAWRAGTKLHIAMLDGAGEKEVSTDLNAAPGLVRSAESALSLGANHSLTHSGFAASRLRIARPRGSSTSAGNFWTGAVGPMAILDCDTYDFGAQTDDEIIELLLHPHLWFDRFNRQNGTARLAGAGTFRADLRFMTGKLLNKAAQTVRAPVLQLASTISAAGDLDIQMTDAAVSAAGAAGANTLTLRGNASGTTIFTQMPDYEPPSWRGRMVVTDYSNTPLFTTYDDSGTTRGARVFTTSDGMQATSYTNCHWIQRTTAAGVPDRWPIPLIGGFLVGYKLWLTATAYLAHAAGVAGTRVRHNAVNYRCILDHTSGASTEPGVGASWATNWEAMPDGDKVYDYWFRTTSTLSRDHHWRPSIVYESNESMFVVGFASHSDLDPNTPNTTTTTTAATQLFASVPKTRFDSGGLVLPTFDDQGEGILATPTNPSGDATSWKNSAGSHSVMGLVNGYLVHAVRVRNESDGFIGVSAISSAAFGDPWEFFALTSAGGNGPKPLAIIPDGSAYGFHLIWMPRWNDGTGLFRAIRGAYCTDVSGVDVGVNWTRPDGSNLGSVDEVSTGTLLIPANDEASYGHFGDAIGDGLGNLFILHSKGGTPAGTAYWTDTPVAGNWYLTARTGWNSTSKTHAAVRTHNVSSAIAALCEDAPTWNALGPDHNGLWTSASSPGVAYSRTDVRHDGSGNYYVCILDHDAITSDGKILTNVTYWAPHTLAQSSGGLGSMSQKPIMQWVTDPTSNDAILMLAWADTNGVTLDGGTSWDFQRNWGTRIRVAFCQPKKRPSIVFSPLATAYTYDSANGELCCRPFRGWSPTVASTLLMVEHMASANIASGGGDDGVGTQNFVDVSTIVETGTEHLNSLASSREYYPEDEYYPG